MKYSRLILRRCFHTMLLRRSCCRLMNNIADNAIFAVITFRVVCTVYERAVSTREITSWTLSHRMLCHFALLCSCFDREFNSVFFKIEQLISDSNAKCTSAKAMTPKPPKRPIKNESRAEPNARKERNGRRKKNAHTRFYFVLDPFHAKSMNYMRKIHGAYSVSCRS